MFNIKYSDKKLLISKNTFCSLPCLQLKDEMNNNLSHSWSSKFEFRLKTHSAHKFMLFTFLEKLKNSPRCLTCCLTWQTAGKSTRRSSTRRTRLIFVKFERIISHVQIFMRSFRLSVCALGTIGTLLAWKWTKLSTLVKKNLFFKNHHLEIVAEKCRNFACFYLVDISQVPDFNKMYELYDPCTCMFFFRNKHIMIDLGTGNNNKINWAIPDKDWFSIFFIYLKSKLKYSSLIAK